MLKQVITNLDSIADELEEPMLRMDGFDDCCVGYVERCGCPAIFVYDQGKIIDKLMERDGMCYDDAAEYFSFNIEDAYMGDGTPGFFTEVNRDG